MNEIIIDETVVDVQVVYDDITDEYQGLLIEREGSILESYDNTQIPLETAEKLLADFKRMNNGTPVTDAEPEQAPESEPADEPKRETKLIDIRHTLTSEELIEIADEQNALITENINLETDLKAYGDRIKPQIKSNEARIGELHKKYMEKEVNRTVVAEAEYDWDNGVIHWLHPDSFEYGLPMILETTPIPPEKRQMSIDDVVPEEQTEDEDFEPTPIFPQEVET